MKIILYAILILLPLFSTLAQENLCQKLAGRILLEVKSHGEAWYINPGDLKKYFLGRPQEAFALMQKFGIGITDNDLKKIPLGSLSEDDRKKDSDNDGYDDYTEIQNEYDPYGPGKQNIDSGFTKKHLGKIFIQTEKQGEAWYVNPVDQKRYFLNRPQNAFDIMKKLGLGISTEDLAPIAIGILYDELDTDSTKNDSVNEDVINQAAQAIRSGNKETAIKYFIPEMSRAIEYTIDFLNPEGRLALGNILSGSRLESSSENKKVYRNEVYFNGEEIPVYFYIEKFNNTWLMTNL